mmetsp:Transcript_23635/g.40448  ORF Transcript_23635/g.40448 Transcript_23635/m.40448 type:complete len:89 (+) Transcript_23635:267-533(+)
MRYDMRRRCGRLPLTERRGARNSWAERARAQREQRAQRTRQAEDGRDKWGNPTCERTGPSSRPRGTPPPPPSHLPLSPPLAACLHGPR